MRQGVLREETKWPQFFARHFLNVFIHMGAVHRTATAYAKGGTQACPLTVEMFKSEDGPEPA
jgi:hypothetical protein